MYIAPSPNAEIINQAAAAVVEAQQRESSMRTEAERVVLTTQAQAAQRESSLRSEAERVDDSGRGRKGAPNYSGTSCSEGEFPPF